MVSRKTKREKQKQVKDKFTEERTAKAVHIQAKTENQALFLKAMQDKTLIVGKGSAGVGKSFLAAATAANKYLRGDVDEIILLRPYVQMGRSSGFWPGSIQERLGPYFAPMLNVLRKRFGENQFNNLYGKHIHIQPIEAVRGMDFQNSFIIVDEAQNLTREEVRSLVTRVGNDSQFVCIGDDAQRDLKEQDCGLIYLVNLLKKHNIPNTAVIEFTPDDVVRSDLAGTFVKIFDKEGPLK